MSRFSYMKSPPFRMLEFQLTCYANMNPYVNDYFFFNINTPRLDNLRRYTSEKIAPFKIWVEIAANGYSWHRQLILSSRCHLHL